MGSKEPDRCQLQLDEEHSSNLYYQTSVSIEEEGAMILTKCQHKITEVSLMLQIKSLDLEVYQQIHREGVTLYCQLGN